ncbi:MAG: hypothetical protein WBF55_10365 [Syntrophobacteria bacterium]
MARYTRWPRSGKTGTCITIHRKDITLEALTIRVRMTKETMELFSIPVPARQQEFPSADHTKVRVLDNSLEDNLRKYVAWGRL